MDLGVSGLASGFDWRSFIDQMADVERAPQDRLRLEQNTLDQQKNAYGSLKTELSVLKTRSDALKDSTLFGARTVQSSDTSIGKASAANAAALGSYTFSISQLAKAAKQQGADNVGASLSATDNVSTLTLGNASLATSISAGTFTVNGKQITIATTDTLQQVFDRINTATGGTVTGSYSSATDRITLSSSGGSIVLGSATDSSNFLQVTRLANNGTSTISSSANLGAVRQNVALSSSNLSTAVSDGGAGAGQFKINGVAISFNASTDTISDVLNRINNSTAGVQASYDAINDRFMLANKVTGDMGIALEDVTGNFLAATQLSTGSLVRGQNLVYQVNGGGLLTSASNTITEASSGIAGLSVTALQQDEFTVSVSSNTESIKTAINDFVSAYNRVQSLIDSQTASSTDAKGKVTAGILTGQSDAAEISRQLRTTAFSQLSGLVGSLDHLHDLGIETSGYDNSLSLSDSDALDDALQNNLKSVQELFSDSTKGLAVQFSDYLDSLVGDDGSLVTRQDNLTRQIGSIDTQIADMERIVLSNREALITNFVAMEKAQANANQQLQFLQQRFGSS